jgi:hypothetical protein
MNDPASLVALSGTGLLAIGLLSAALLKAWYGWLELRRIELGTRRGGASGAARNSGGEVRDLRERVRRLEAIANGADV